MRLIKLLVLFFLKKENQLHLLQKLQPKTKYYTQQLTGFFSHSMGS